MILKPRTREYKQKKARSKKARVHEKKGKKRAKNGNGCKCRV